MSESMARGEPVRLPVITTEFDIRNPDWDTVKAARDTLVNSLTMQGIDPATKLFAGYNPQVPKDSTNEFTLDSKNNEYYFGTFNSLSPPLPTDDEDLAGEKWVVNPLRYALEAGAVLGVYDETLIAPQLQQNRTDQEFGTFVAAGTESQILAAQIVSVDFH